MIKNLSGYNFYKVNIYSFLWFIPAIMTFYLIFPFYYRVFEKSKNKLMFMISILEIWLFFSLLLRGIEREEMYGFTNRIPIFLIGVFFGWLCQNRNIQLHKAEWLVIVINLILGLYLSFLANFRDLQLIVPVSNCCFPNIMISVSLCFLIAKGMDFINQIHITKWLAKSVTLFMGFFGSISLEMYCVQEWLGDRYLNVLAGRYGNGVANLIFFIIVTLCSLLLRIITKAIIYILDLPFRLRADKSQNSTIDNDRD